MTPTARTDMTTNDPACPIIIGKHTTEGSSEPSCLIHSYTTVW